MTERAYLLHWKILQVNKINNSEGKKKIVYEIAHMEQAGNH